MRTPALIVFDMAGTTIEDAGQVPQAFTEVLARHGIAITEAELSALRGASKRDAIRHFAARNDSTNLEARTDRIFGDFRAHLSTLFRSGGVRPIRGATETIELFRTKGIKVALNTGFDRTIVDLVIEAVGWRDAADAIVCGDDVASGRPAPDLIFKCMERSGIADATAVMTVGDTVLDVRAGRNAGAGWVVGVLSGAHGRAQLEAESPDHLLASVADLPDVLGLRR